MSVVRVGSTKKFADNWDTIFEGKSGGKKTAKKAAAKKKSAKKPAKKKAAKKKR